MKFNPDQYAALEAITPPAEAVQERARAYMETAQIGNAEFARRIGYGVTALNYFLAGRYVQIGISATDVRIRRALVDCMDSNPIEAPADAAGRLYETSNVKVMRQWFQRCLDRREMARIYGPPGVQKTYVLSHLVAEHNRREMARGAEGTRAIRVYCTQGTAPTYLLRRICKAAGLRSVQRVDTLIDNIHFGLGQRKTLIIFDEAQHLSIQCLEVIRELNDNPPHCGVLLAGSHQLFATFRDRAAELVQWNSRIESFIALPGIQLTEMAEIVEAELGPLPADQLRGLLERCTDTDVYVGHRKQKYYSARRLFRQIEDIKSDPRWIAQTAHKESAA